MNQEELAKKMLLPSKEFSSGEIRKRFDLCLSFFDSHPCGHDFGFRSAKGLSTFFVNGVNIFDFLLGGTWNPSSKEFGALPMILGSFIVTILSALIATPFAIGAAVL